jgi:hypothetical protein
VSEYRRALDVGRGLPDDNPNVPEHRHELATCSIDLSVTLRCLGRPSEARDASAAAVTLSQSLVREYPAKPYHRNRLAWSLRRHGLALRDLGDPTGAAADARRALALWDGVPRQGPGWFETACAHAALAGLAGQPGSGVSATEAVPEADAAMALLRKAVAMGHRRSAAYRTEDALDPLRSRDDSRLLMMDLAMPAWPFAP